MNATQHPHERPWRDMIAADRRIVESLPLREGWGPWGLVCTPPCGYAFRSELQRGASRDFAVEGDPDNGWWVLVSDRDRPYLTERDNALKAALIAVRAIFNTPEEAMGAADAAIAGIIG